MHNLAADVNAALERLHPFFNPTHYNSLQDTMDLLQNTERSLYLNRCCVNAGLQRDQLQEAWRQRIECFHRDY